MRANLLIAMVLVGLLTGNNARADLFKCYLADGRVAYQNVAEEGANCDAVSAAKAPGDYHWFKLSKRWVLIASGSDGSVVHIDTQSIFSRDNTTEFWVHDEAATYGSEKPFYSLRQFRADCSRRRLGVVASTDYDSKGRTIRGGPAAERNDNISLSPVVPDSVGEKMLERVCVSATKGRTTNRATPKP